jgi:antitoxin component of MazEF toxin-antitoxin module
VTRISADLSAATTSYIGTADDDSIDSIAFMGTKIYVSGRTEGTLGATARGDIDGFVARVDAAAGTVEEINQFGTISQETGPVRLAVAQGGGGTALQALGLPSGELAPTASVKIASQVGLKTGDSFSVVVDGGKTIKIEIEANDTLDTLMKRMATKLSAVASVTTSSVDGKRALSIYVKSGHGLSLISGPTGSDALAKLGIKPGQIASAAIAQEGDPKVKPGGKFNLALSTALTLDTKANAEYALKMIKSAVSMTQSAYRSLYWDDSKAMLVNGNMSGGGDAYTQSRMAAYQAALTRLTT